MECLIQDFPFGNGSSQTAEDSNAPKPTDESMFFLDKTLNGDLEDEETFEKTSVIKVVLRFDGLNYKMRLRKEETVLKVIDLSLDFTGKKSLNQPDEMEAEIELTDF